MQSGSAQGGSKTQGIILKGAFCPTSCTTMRFISGARGRFWVQWWEGDRHTKQTDKTNWGELTVWSVAHILWCSLHQQAAGQKQCNHSNNIYCILSDLHKAVYVPCNSNVCWFICCQETQKFLHGTPSVDYILGKESATCDMNKKYAKYTYECLPEGNCFGQAGLISKKLVPGLVEHTIFKMITGCLPILFGWALVTSA